MRWTWGGIAVAILCSIWIGWNVARAAPRKDPVERVEVIQDFEVADLADAVEPSAMVGVRVAHEGDGAGHGFRGTVAGGARVSWLSFYTVPRDITRFRTLRMRLRSLGGAGPPLSVRLVNKPASLGLDYQIKEFGASWETIDIPLPAMSRDPSFDPTSVVSLELLWFAPPAFAFLIDDVQLVEVDGAGGWEYSEAEMIERTFGAKRSKKVKHLPTEHFDIYTDSAAARKKFPAALEATYTFVRTALGVPEFTSRLPVYIHQNSKLYFDFCVRHVGWSLESAQNSAGHGSGRYFATYYQSPTSDVVTHELTHSIFHRSVGGWGGSWFQEGVAVYVEHLAADRSAATEFSPLLRSRRHTPLRDFISIDRLLDAHNERGGSSEAAQLYLQAGALFEFLLRTDALRPRAEVGPLVEAAPAGLPKAMFELAQAVEEGPALVQRVEEIVGMSIEDLEAAWIAWGSRPPKRE